MLAGERSVDVGVAGESDWGVNGTASGERVGEVDCGRCSIENGGAAAERTVGEACGSDGKVRGEACCSALMWCAIYLGL